MDYNEIVMNYKQAKDKKAQIKILAELNACSEEEILKILVESGIDSRMLPRKRKPEAAEVVETETDKTLDGVSEALKQKDELIEQLRGRISQLEDKNEEYIGMIQVRELELGNLRTEIENRAADSCDALLEDANRTIAGLKLDIEQMVQLLAKFKTKNKKLKKALIKQVTKI